jgi:isomerase DpgB
MIARERDEVGPMPTGRRTDPGLNGSEGRCLTLRVDGGRGLTAEAVAELSELCHRVEDGDADRAVVLQVSGVPGTQWSSGLTVGLVSKWERALRRLERLPAVIVAVADGDCGGTALDALLAADYRVLTAAARLVLPVVAGSTWPGLALYRLTRQTAGAVPARRAVLLGEPIGAADAQRIAVADDVADDAAAALERALEVAQAASTAPGAEIAIRRQLMAEAMSTAFEDALGVHLAACDRLLRTAALEVA